MSSQPPPSADGVVTKACPWSVADAVDRLRQILEQQRLVQFAVIDHSGEARRVGLELRDTKLVIFGSPPAGTPVMVAAPLAALDLPLKLLVWQDDEGAVWVSHDAPAYLADRHHLGEDLRGRLEAIDTISDAVIAAP